MFRTFGEQFAAENGITVAVQELGLDDIRDRTIIAGRAQASAALLRLVRELSADLAPTVPAPSFAADGVASTTRFNVVAAGTRP